MATSDPYKIDEPSDVTAVERDLRELFRDRYVPNPQAPSELIGTRLDAGVVRGATTEIRKDMRAGRLGRVAHVLLSDPQIYGGIIHEYAGGTGPESADLVKDYLVEYVTTGASRPTGTPHPTADPSQPVQQPTESTESTQSTVPRQLTQSGTPAASADAPPSLSGDSPGGGGGTGWDPCVSGLPLFDRTTPIISTTVDPAPVKIAAELAYVITYGDGLRVFSTSDKIRDLVAGGARIAFKDDSLLDEVYCAERMETVMPRTTRMAVAAGVLGVDDDDLPRGATINREFPMIIGRILDACLRFRQEQCECGASAALASTLGATSRKAADLLREQARWNAQNAVTGFTTKQTQELSARLTQDLRLLKDKGVTRYLGVDDGDVLGVLAAVQGTPGERMGDVVAFAQAAEARDTVFDWIIGDPVTDKDNALFDAAVEAAFELDATQSLMTGDRKSVV